MLNFTPAVGCNYPVKSKTSNGIVNGQENVANFLGFAKFWTLLDIMEVSQRKCFITTHEALLHNILVRPNLVRGTSTAT